MKKEHNQTARRDKYALKNLLENHILEQIEYRNIYEALAKPHEEGVEDPLK